MKKEVFTIPGMLIYIYRIVAKESSKSKLKVLLRKKGPRQSHDLNFGRVSNLKTK